MKKLILLFAAVYFCTSLHAQFYKSVLPDKKFTEPFSLIIQSFKKNYLEVKGEKPEEDGISHHCTVKLPGQIRSELIFFNWLYDTSAAYRALFYEGDDYREAVRIYRNLCYDVKKIMKWTGSSYAGFKGQIEDPFLKQKSTTTLLHFDQPGIYRHYYAQIDFIFLVTKFTVTLSLISKKQDDLP
ncbi:MAG: hypothetical protein JWN76_2053 [Chitinophagaceae bacterium]|nr:hypothetical protein [Chitinophagaceae bacterium]